MKKRRGGLLQRMMAVLLSVVLVTGMVANAVPMTVLAQETAEQQENTGGSGTEPAAGDTKPEEKTETAPAEGTGSGEQEKTDPEGQEEPGTTEGDGGTEKGDGLTGQEPGGGMEEKPQEPGGGTEGEQPKPGDGAGEEQPEPENGPEEKPQESVSENDVEQENVQKQRVLRVAPAPRAAIIAGSESDGWVLDTDGRLTISSDRGMEGWISNGRNNHSSKVTSAGILDGVARISGAAFNGCSGMKSITISKSVTSIGMWAFNDCSSLTGITIPSKVGEIGNAAFGDCSSLKTVTMLCETPPTVGSDAFYGCKFVTDNTQGVHVPEGKAEDYKKEWTAWAAYIADDPAPAEEHKHNDVTFTAWTATDRLPTDAGNYYLTENVTLNQPWYVISDATSLCLNGKNIQLAEVKEGNNNIAVISIQENAALKLFNCDQSGIGGKISGGSICGVLVISSGSFYLYGGTITENGTLTAVTSAGVMNLGTFYMHGGGIEDNRLPSNGIMSAGLINNGSFYMYGGKIVRNRTDSWGAGVYNGSGNTVVIGGSAVIADNTDSDGGNNNLFLNSNDVITVDDQNPLSDSAQIGVLTDDLPEDLGMPVNITGANNQDYHQYFFSDDPNYEIVNGENNVVQLAVKADKTPSLTLDPTTLNVAKGETAQITMTAANADGYTFKAASSDTDKTTVTETATDNKFTVTGKAEGTATITVTGTKSGAAIITATCAVTVTDGTAPPTPAEKYTVTVNGGTVSGGTGSANFAAGVTVSITANPPASGKQFDKWKIDSENVTLDSATNSTTSFTMPEEAVEVTATYKNKTGGSGSGGGNGSGSGNSGSGDNHGGGDIPGGNDNSGSSADGGNNAGNTGGTGAGTSGKSGAPGTGQPKVKQEKEGNIWKEVRVEGADTLDAAVETPLSELADIVLTKEEKQKAAGGTDVKVVLDVKDASAVVSAADKALVEKALNSAVASGYTLGQYLDISLYKVIGDSRTAIQETDGKITVRIDVPDNLRNTDPANRRTFAVIRVHNGKAELLTDLDNDPDTITIATDRFSTYALVYKDTENGNGSIRVRVVNGSGKTSGGGKDGEPKTGDATPIELYATLFMITGFTYLLLYFSDRKRGMSEETKKELVSSIVAWAKRGGRIRRYLALAAIFFLLAYYHSIGKKCDHDHALCANHVL